MAAIGTFLTALEYKTCLDIEISLHPDVQHISPCTDSDTASDVDTCTHP